MHALRLAAVSAVLAACASAKPQPEPAAKTAVVEQPAPAPAPAAEAPAIPADQMRAAEKIADESKAPPPAAELLAARVYFAFDRSELTPTSRARLAHLFDAATTEGARVRIEGNCDERGTNEYNLALGQRRADAAKAYLVRMGVPADRITTVSYGEEHPRAPGHDEESWRENRRDDVFIAGAPAVSLR